MKNILVLVIAVIALAGCSASVSRMSMGNCKVEMYSGGRLVQTWTSSGRVLSEEGSDGWYFTDSASKKVVIVSGDIVITPL